MKRKHSFHHCLKTITTDFQSDWKQVFGMISVKVKLSEKLLAPDVLTRFNRIKQTSVGEQERLSGNPRATELITAAEDAGRAASEAAATDAC